MKDMIKSKNKNYIVKPELPLHREGEEITDEFHGVKHSFL